MNVVWILAFTTCLEATRSLATIYTTCRSVMTRTMHPVPATSVNWIRRKRRSSNRVKSATTSVSISWYRTCLFVPVEEYRSTDFARF